MPYPGRPSPTPQAHATRREALELGAALIEYELEVMRGIAQGGGTPGGSTEAAVMDAMHKGISAGRLRELVEVEKEKEERKRLERR